MNITELIKALEEAEGPSRALDAEIAVFFDVRPKFMKERRGKLWFNGSDLVYWIDDPTYSKGPKHPVYNVLNMDTGRDSVPFFSSSTDAAFTLCERVLPGWIATVSNRDTLHGEHPFADVASRDFINFADNEGNQYAHASGATMAMAIRFSGVTTYQNEPPLNSLSKVDKSTP